jgi:hypothetical protein
MVMKTIPATEGRGAREASLLAPEVAPESTAASGSQGHRPWRVQGGTLAQRLQGAGPPAQWRRGGESKTLLFITSVVNTSYDASPSRTTGLGITDQLVGLLILTEGFRQPLAQFGTV